MADRITVTPAPDRLSAPEIGVELLITDRMLNATVEEEVTRLLDFIKHSFATRMIVDGAERVTNTTTAWERDASLRSWMMQIVAEEDFSDPSLRFLLARSVQEVQRMRGQLAALNFLPLWKIVWLRLRGKPLVRYE